MDLMPPRPGTYFCFFSAGLRICIEHVSPRCHGHRASPKTYLEGAEQTLIHTHHGAGVVELAAVVGRAEEGYELALREELVTILDDLVSTADQVHVMFLKEPGNHVRSKGERHATVILAPSSDVLIRVGPQEIAKQTTVGDLEQG